MQARMHHGCGGGMQGRVEREKEKEEERYREEEGYTHPGDLSNRQGWWWLPCYTADPCSFLLYQ